MGSIVDSAKKIIKMTDVVVFLVIEIVVGSCKRLRSRRQLLNNLFLLNKVWAFT